MQTHTLSQIAQTNTQMPQPAFHLSADRRNTPATSSQSAFHHSVTTCQLQSPSLRHTALIFTNCAAAWDTTQPCQKIWHWKRNSPASTCLYIRPCARAVTYMHVWACTAIFFPQRMKTTSNSPHKSSDVIKSAVHMRMVTCTYFHSFSPKISSFFRSSVCFCTCYQGTSNNQLSARVTD